DPDVILVGEMRDLETVGAAITAAETGHLVSSTLHTVNAPQTIERIIDVYPADEQNQIRSMLANTLQAVISQTLFKRCDQPGMIPLNLSFGPSAKDVQNCTSQLAVMIRAGISIRAAIEGISEQVENPKFKEMLIQMKKDVESGKSFSDALLRYPKVFTPLYINMVKASELSGGFSKMLDKVANYLSQQIETSSMVKGAMIYPGIIGTMAVGTTV